jgi:hypothetical protein
MVDNGARVDYRDDTVVRPVDPPSMDQLAEEEHRRLAGTHDVSLGDM